MLALRDVHEGGTTRVAIDGDHVLTGGADGVVALFPVKRWPKSASLWARQCHESGVTNVVLHDALHLGLSCGRDGKIVLHENIHETGDDASKSTSRVICRVTGEVRCLYFDATQQRVFVGGDSLRCLHMTSNRFHIQTIPLPIPHPLVALALSPCGRLLAAANAGGSVAVIGVVPPTAVADLPTPTSAPPSERELLEADALRKVKFVFSNVLSPSAKREEACTYRMQWCPTGGGAVLAVPTAVEVLIYQLRGDLSAPAGYQMRCIGGLHAEQLIDLHGVGLYPLSSHRMMCVMASQEGVYMAKVSSGKLAMTHHRLQKYDGGPVITDMQVNSRTGDVVVGLRDGKVSLLHRAALKGLDAGKAAAPRGRQTPRPAANAEGNPPPGSETPDEDEDEAGVGEGSQFIDRQAKAKSRKERPGSSKRVALEDDFINDASTSSGSRDGGSDAADSSSDSGSVSSTDGDAEEVEEDLEKVVSDLKSRGSGFVDVEGGARPSRWRKEDPKRVVASVRRQSSRFLDDEAEEASSGDAEAEDEMAYEEDGYGERNRRHRAYDGDDGNTGVVASDDEARGSDAGDRSSLSELHPAVDGADVGGAASLAKPGAVVRDYAFQVGATPAGEEGSCYLAYNAVGFIHCTREAATVHFHDISYPAVRVHENGVVLMGTLSPVGAGFVILPPDVSGEAAGLDSVDDAPRLVVYFRTFVSLGAQSDWRVRLLPGETVRCIAAGIHFIAVATSRYLRLFSLSGLEIGVLSKFPRIVAMAGTSSRKLMGSYKVDFDPLAVVFLEGGELKMEVMNVANRSTVVPARVVPLTAAADGSTHELQWLGWSEDGPLHTVDTAGVVRMYTASWGGSWIPVYDPRSLADASTNLWIWGVNDESLYAYRSSAAAGSPYPAAVSGGLPTEHVPLFLPLTRSINEKDVGTWDHLLRREIRADELKLQSSVYTQAIAWHDAWHDKKLLGLFRWALQEQLTTRALDLATLMELRDNVEVCAKEANSRGHTQLVHKLLSVYEMRVKTRSKRKCTLPLEGSAVSEKERDLLLRKLLLKEKEGLQRGEPNGAKRQAAESPESGGPVEATTPPRAKPPTTPHPTNPETPPKPTEGGGDRPQAPGTSPGGRSTTTAESSPTRQRVTFVLPTDTQSTATNTTATTVEARKPAPVARTPPLPAATKPMNPFGRAAPLSIPPTAPPRVASRDGPVEIRGDFQTKKPSPFIAAAPPPLPSRIDVDDGPVELLGGSQPPLPVDPFLRGASPTGEGAGLTVRAVLDQGHGDDEAVQPRSRLFGEALRKRYRDDDDDDDERIDGGGERGGGLPALAVPRIA
ncbi:unnamed protein product [Phytomonas sp. EM1]|nr:unnamed protein product [Phytomonas sp. EM1]|eukprot:CCW63018.1 unnamed protein product [Phytomonas sp. isolate EM1]